MKAVWRIYGETELGGDLKVLRYTVMESCWPNEFWDSEEDAEVALDDKMTKGLSGGSYTILKVWEK